MCHICEGSTPIIVKINKVGSRDSNMIDCHYVPQSHLDMCIYLNVRFHVEERTASVVDCLTRDQRVTG